jgi:hypothetical protein
MDIFFGNLFWGVLLILIGASIILKGMGINFPFVKTFIAIVIILFGIKLLVGSHNVKYFKSKKIHTVRVAGNSREYTTVFSSNITDLSDLKDTTKDMEITVVFGSSVVRLPNNIDYDIEPTAVFGTVNLPSRMYKDNVVPNPDKRIVYIEATAVFGRLDFVFVDPIVSDSTEFNVSRSDADTDF